MLEYSNATVMLSKYFTVYGTKHLTVRSGINEEVQGNLNCRKTPAYGQQY